MADESTKLPVGRGRSSSGEMRSYETLQDAVNRMFDDFGRGFFRTPFRPPSIARESFGEMTSVPAADVAEHDTEYEITLELPGMEASEVDVKFANGAVTITGEKKQGEGRQEEGLLPLRTSVWLVPPLLCRARRCRHFGDRGRLFQGASHRAAAQDRRGPGEGEEDFGEIRLRQRSEPALPRRL